MDTSFCAATEESGLDHELNYSLVLAKTNAEATKSPKRTSSKKANREWKIGSPSDEENEGVDETLPTRRISFGPELTVAKFYEDGTIQTESKNAFPFPVGTNPDVQTVSYGMDIEGIEDRSALQNFDVAAVLKNDPQTIVVHFSGSSTSLEIETSFKIGFMVATPTFTGDAVCFVVWHAKNDQISVINLEGTETFRGNLPELPIGWTWSDAKFLTNESLELQIYNSAIKEYSTLECPMFCFWSFKSRMNISFFITI